MNIHDWNWEDAIAVAKKESREEGLERGKAEEKEKIAQNLLIMGMSVQLAAQATELPIARVHTIKESIEHK